MIVQTNRNRELVTTFRMRRTKFRQVAKARRQLRQV
jgi:hypothetical protein